MYTLALTLFPGEADALAKVIRAEYPAQGLAGTADIVVTGITRHEDASGPVATIALRSPFPIQPTTLVRLAFQTADLLRRP